MSEPSKFQAIMGGQCPRCRRGRMYSHSFYSKAGMTMNETCDHCQFKFELQPGFFWGAMFFNYAFVVAIFTIQTVALNVLDLMNTIWLYIVSPVTVILLLPIIIRYSRILFLHLFGGIKFEGKRVD